VFRVYADICALKRPWDDQGQARIARETEAMAEIMAAWRGGWIELIRSSAHDLEYSFNTDEDRAHAIRETLARANAPMAMPGSVERRAEELAEAGFRGLDALHLAWAEFLGADVLVTTDDRFRKRALTRAVASSVRTIGPVELVAELEP
jgi:hypothetical protein